MNTRVWKIDELKESRELMEMKNSPFITYFLISLLLFIVSGLIWSWFFKIDIVVKASGMVRPNEQIVKVTNKATGKVSAVYYQSGQHVKAGDLLYELDVGLLEDEEQLIYKHLLEKKEELAAFTDYRKALLNNEEEATNATTNTARDLLIKNSKESEIILQVENTEIGMKKEMDILVNLNILQKSIQNNKNFFNTYNEYYYRYENYLLQVKQYMLEKQQLQEEYKVSAHNNSGEMNSKNGLQANELTLDKLRNDTLLQVAQEILKTKSDLETLKSQKKELYLNLNDKINSIQAEIENLTAQHKSALNNIEDRKIKAEIDGNINIISELAVGENIQAGLEVVTIIPADNSEYNVQLAVLNTDIARIKIGEKIKYKFAALPEKDYGQLEGYVISINSDSTSNSGTGKSYYLVTGSITNRMLINNRGEGGEVKVGMAAEGYVVSRREKILFWFLKKIDLIN